MYLKKEEVLILKQVISELRPYDIRNFQVLCNLYRQEKSGKIRIDSAQTAHYTENTSKSQA